MAIDQTITGNDISASTTPSGGSVDVIVDGNSKFKDMVVLEFKTPGMAEFKVMERLPIGSRLVMSTPDQSIEYRFRGINLSDQIYVYLGP